MKVTDEADDAEAVMFEDLESSESEVKLETVVSGELSDEMGEIDLRAGDC